MPTPQSETFPPARPATDRASFFDLLARCWPYRRHAGHQLTRPALPGSDDAWILPKAEPKAVLSFLHGVHAIPTYGLPLLTWLKDTDPWYDNHLAFYFPFIGHYFKSFWTLYHMALDGLRKHPTSSLPIIWLGHSMGGIMSRYAVRDTLSERQSLALATVASPHMGSLLGWLSPFPASHSMGIGSKVISGLPPSPEIPTLAVSASHDLFVLPRRRLAWPDVNHVHFRGMTHASIMASRDTWQLLHELFVEALEPVWHRQSA